MERQKKKRVKIYDVDGELVTNFCVNEGNYKPLTPSNINQFIREYQQHNRDAPDIRTIDEVLNKVENDIDQFLKTISDDRRNLQQKEQQIKNNEKILKQKLRVAHQKARDKLDEYFQSLSSTIEARANQERIEWENQKSRLNQQLLEIEAVNTNIKKSLNGQDPQKLLKDLFYFLSGTSFEDVNSQNIQFVNQHEKNQNFLNQIAQEQEFTSMDISVDESYLEELRIILSKYAEVKNLPVSEYLARNRDFVIQRTVLPNQTIIEHPIYINEPPIQNIEVRNGVIPPPVIYRVDQNQYIPPIQQVRSFTPPRTYLPIQQSQQTTLPINQQFMSSSFYQSPIKNPGNNQNR